MAFRAVGEGRSAQRGFFLSNFRHRFNPRMIMTCFFGLALCLTVWTIYVTGTMHDVLRLVRLPLYGSSEPTRDSGLGPEPETSIDGLEGVPSPAALPPLQDHSNELLPGEWGPSGSKSASGAGEAGLPVVPANLKVIGIVFFGRRDLVQILDCYLQRNLKVNGGLLDEVIFSVNTKNQDDLAYLDALVKTNKAYRKYVSTKSYDGWSVSWEPVTDPHAIYVKIDDDVVFIEDSTIPAIVTRLHSSPQLFAVSANVVNNPALSWVHYSMGVYEPFWPELVKPDGPVSTSWKPSTLPSYQGPPTGPDGFRDGAAPAPFEGHRWLPVRPQPGEAPYDITLTPASTLTYDAFGPSLHNWAAAAQTHYSFLSHLERNETLKYHFDVWDYAYARLSINFLAVRGRDILDAFPFPTADDEDFLTTMRPKELGRHVVVDGAGVAVHFAFNPQYSAHEHRGVAWTDALGRYRRYAEENVCLPGSLLGVGRKKAKQPERRWQGRMRRWQRVWS